MTTCKDCKHYNIEKGICYIHMEMINKSSCCSEFQERDVEGHD